MRRPALAALATALLAGYTRTVRRWRSRTTPTCPTAGCSARRATTDRRSPPSGPRRAHAGPLVEVFQYKGSGETQPSLSPTDEFAGFERKPTPRASCRRWAARWTWRKRPTPPTEAELQASLDQHADIQRRPAWACSVVPYAIGSVAMFWVFERVAAF